MSGTAARPSTAREDQTPNERVGYRLWSRSLTCVGCESDEGSPGRDLAPSLAWLWMRPPGGSRFGLVKQPAELLLLIRIRGLS